MGHMVSSLLFLKQRIFFFMCILKTIFPKTVFPKTCFVFPIFIGGEACFLTFVIHWGVVTLHREGCLYFLWSWIVLCSLNSLFSLDFCCVCFLFTLCLSCLCQYVTKRGRKKNWSKYGNPICLGGYEIFFERRSKKKF